LSTLDLFEPIAVEPPDGEAGREERDAYYTPDALARAICEKTLKGALHLDASLDSCRARILEPGCGGGAFLRAAAAAWPAASILGVDLVPACSGPGEVRQQDVFTVQGSYDLIVGNPPFMHAEAVVRHCLGLLAPGGTLALLLLASFEESGGRVRLYAEHPLYARQMVAERASFRADGQTDQRAYAVFVWKQGWAGPDYRGLQPLVWKWRGGSQLSLEGTR
jgi:SAM-dependent methyltransferase